MIKRETFLPKEFLDWLTKNFVRHGGECMHFHRIGTKCLSISEHPDAISFPIYRRAPQLRVLGEPNYPYFLDEQSMIGYFEYEIDRE